MLSNEELTFYLTNLINNRDLARYFVSESNENEITDILMLLINKDLLNKKSVEVYCFSPRDKVYSLFLAKENKIDIEIHVVRGISVNNWGLHYFEFLKTLGFDIENKKVISSNFY